MDHRWISRYFLKTCESARYIAGKKTKLLHLSNINLFFYNYYKKHIILHDNTDLKVLQNSVLCCLLKMSTITRLPIQESCLLFIGDEYY